jgi:hypothetical protein
MTLIGARGGQNPFKLDAGDYIFVLFISVLGDDVGVTKYRQTTGLNTEFVKAGGKNHRSHLDDGAFLGLVKINGLAFAELFTGSAFPFPEINAGVPVYGIDKGYGLRILDIDRLSFGQAFIKIIPHFDRAFLGTHTAAHTFGRVHVFGLLEDQNLKIAGRSCYLLNA